MSGWWPLELRGNGGISRATEQHRLGFKPSSARYRHDLHAHGFRSGAGGEREQSRFHREVIVTPLAVPFLVANGPLKNVFATTLVKKQLGSSPSVMEGLLTETPATFHHR